VNKNHRGFTLIEMLLVLVILSTLAAMVVPRFAGRSEEAKISAARVDVQANLASALDLYELDNGHYPTTAQGLEALLREPSTAPLPKNWKGPYLKHKSGLKDPWGNPYQYREPGSADHRDYDLFSMGPDGAAGGTDDLLSWEDEK
jgi:general secretion pathway protein G